LAKRGGELSRIGLEAIEHLVQLGKADLPLRHDAAELANLAEVNPDG
jgi:hypothetical protein